MSVKIEANPITKVEVELVGQTYMVTPPKWALAMKMAVQARTTAKDDPTVMVDTLYQWIDKAFGKVDAKKVRARLDDENDALDIQHIMQLMEAVMEDVSENPTS